MNLRFCTNLILTVWFAGFAFTGIAQPNWELNPYDYEFSMNITGKITIDGTFSVDENDMVAAFANDECRGFAKLTYENFANEYFVYLMVYSNSSIEELTFKIFDASENEIKTANDTLEFIVNKITGSLDSPFIFSSGDISSEAKILNFEIPGQQGETFIDGTTINLKRNSGSSSAEIAASFSLSEGATVFVDGVKQVSNVTKNDFSSPVEFMVVSANLSDTVFYIVNVTMDINNPPTAIYLSNIFIRESTGSNTLVATLNAEDKDISDTYSFGFAPGDGYTDAQNSFFGIVGNNLLLLNPLDYEKKQLLNILISVTDGGENSYKESFILQVIDENDPPTAIQLSNKNINESAELNSIVAILSAEDADLVDSHNFKLIDGNGLNDAQNSFFSIENEKLILLKPLSFEENPDLHVLIGVTDKDSAYLQEEIVLNVTNENDPPTSIYLSNTSVNESIEPFTTVAVIKAVDQDLFDSHQFSLIEGDGENDMGNTFFTIVGDKLVLTKTLNFEDKQSLNVLMRATDKSGAFIEETLVLQITNTNDPPTAINLSNKFVSESTGLNTIVAILEAEDPDLLDSHSFSLISGNGTNDAQNNLFKIVGDNLILAQPLDFENTQLLHVLIRVTDVKGAFFDKSVELTVTNDNDPPKFNSTPLNYILEDEIFIYPILVTDADSDPLEISFENLPDWLVYHSNSKIISGVPGNGEVGDYTFKIMASDGQIESVQIVAFTVINVNEPPEISSYIEDQLFLSNRYNEIQLPVDCIIDPDIDDELTFKLATENNSALPAWLSFNKETLVISGFPPQGIQATYNLKLTATDNGKLKEFLIFNLEVTIPTATGDQNRNTSFRVFPNPVKNNLNFDIPDGNEDATISIINISGQIIKTWQISPGLANTVSMNGFEPGIYFVRLQQGMTEQIKKIIKE